MKITVRLDIYPEGADPEKDEPIETIVKTYEEDDLNAVDECNG